MLKKILGFFGVWENLLFCFQDLLTFKKEVLLSIILMPLVRSKILINCKFQEEFIDMHIFFRISWSTYVIYIYYFLLATVKKPLVQEDWHYFWDTILVAWTLQWCAWISALLCTFVGSCRCRPVHRKGTTVEFQTHKISEVQGSTSNGVSTIIPFLCMGGSNRSPKMCTKALRFKHITADGNFRYRFHFDQVNNG